jgi:hypothetical protein
VSAQKSIKVGDSFTRITQSVDITRTVIRLEGMYVIFSTTHSEPGRKVLPERKSALESFADWANKADKYENKHHK